MTVGEFAGEAKTMLGDRLLAVYEFGSGFARGPKAKQARLLIVVSRIDRDLLRDIRRVAQLAQDANFQLQFDTANDIRCGADVFPVFTLELLDTKRLVLGADVLADVTVHTAHLRQRVEQGLRALHRDLLRAYASAADDRTLATQLRTSVRKAVYLLRALALVCDLDWSPSSDVEALVDTTIGALLPDSDRTIWHRMRKMANFEEPAPPDYMLALYGNTIVALGELVDAVDKL